VREERARADTPGPVRALELHRVRLPLVRAFRTARSTTTYKDALLVRVVTDDAAGWGECAAETTPAYSGETLDGARLVIREHLAPRVFAGRDFTDVRGNHFAKYAVAMACLDARLRESGESLRSWLAPTRVGVLRTRVPAGVAIGITAGEQELRELAAAYVAAGYRRLKCKIQPGADLAIVAAVRAEVGDGITLAVDANGSYDLTESDVLGALDAFGLQCIEQPLSPDSLRDHAALARGLQTRVCLDETVTSAGAAMDALAWQASDMVNIKPGRVGGVDVARTVHDLCVVAGVPAVIGGMLETGVGRAVNVALASLPGFTEAGDLSASDRYFVEDVTDPFLLDGGQLTVPAGPGIGVTPRPEMLRRYTVAREVLTPRSSI
jgi:o-succinylbenzoate synthase